MTPPPIPNSSRPPHSRSRKQTGSNMDRSRGEQIRSDSYERENAVSHICGRRTSSKELDKKGGDNLAKENSPSFSLLLLLPLILTNYHGLWSKKISSAKGKGKERVSRKNRKRCNEHETSQNLLHPRRHKVAKKKKDRRRRP